MASHDEGAAVTPGLITRLQDIPGVEAVAVDLASYTGGINLLISPDANEREVLREVHELLVAYGVRGLVRPRVTMGQPRPMAPPSPPVDVEIKQMEHGARIQVTVGEVQSARQVAATPTAIAQGLADAWAQVLGETPQEIVAVTLSETGGLTVVASNGSGEHRGVADVGDGWTKALVQAVGTAMGFLNSDGTKRSDMARTAW